MNAIVDWEDKESTMSVHDIKGSVKFYQKNKYSPVIVSVVIYGLPDGFHGFHIHEKKIEDFGEDVMECCDKLGGHFNVGEKWSLKNQSGTKHGIDGHTGDLCNNIYSENNFCEIYFEDDKISLYKKLPNFIGNRSIVIHKDKDDMGLPNYKDKKKNVDKFITGNAGKRIACGNIKII